MTIPNDGLQLRSLVKESGEIELSLVRVPTPMPAADEVVVRVEATPINPSDIGLLFGAADLATLAVRGSGEQTVVTARIPPAAMKAMAARVGQSLAVGNEGAGTVVAAGSGAAAQALVGRTVAVLGGAMYSQLRTVKAEQCLPLPRGTSAADGASAFVN
ncbi:MAG TPA: NADH oxidase, partial [Caldimonas sp.]|nr:NADH oxidase [Caldimonas sp.]